MERSAAAADSPAATPTERARVRRKAERGRYDRAEIDAILAEGLIGHLGFALDGRPWVIPLVYARVGDTLYLHGAAANHALRAVVEGAEACFTVTLVDGLVLARSSFHHSINYRSVVVFGAARRVDDPDEKRRAVDAVVEHVVPGRTADARPPTHAELRSTLVAALPLDEASAKVRAGPPIDDGADLDLAVWAGEVPFETVAQAPIADPVLPVGIEAPWYARHYARRRALQP